MLTLERIRELPANIDEFIEEIGEGMGRLYGPAAAREYFDTARTRLLVMLRHPRVETFACLDADDAAGLLWFMVHDDIGHIAFIHVLQRYSGKGIEEELINEAVIFLRERGVRAILSEGLCFGATDARAAYRGQGFRRVERLVMSAPLDAAGLACAGPASTSPCDPGRRRSAADIIVAAYRDHPDRLLHPDVHDTAAALRFLDTATQGGYGRACPAYLRLYMNDGQAVGAVIGCEAASGVGFVLQVAVRPAFQGRGIGACLLRELAAEFRAAGLIRVALGVSVSNPARRLYERLGFVSIHGVDAHIWWRNGDGPPA